MDTRLLRAIAEDWPAPVVYRSVSVLAPAVATDWVATVPGESVWGIVGIVATLVCDANVANRHPDLTVTDGTAALYRVTAPFAITANATAVLSWVPGLGYANTALLGNRATIGTPELALPSGFTIGPSGSGLQAGDQWSAITVTVVEVFHGHVEHERTLADSFRNEADALAGVIERGY